MTIIETNDCGSKSEFDENNDNKINRNQLDKTPDSNISVNGEYCPQSDQSAWLAEENNVVLLSLSHNEKIVLSKVKPLNKSNNVSNENSNSEVELISADLDSKNNQVSQVRIITENGQTFDFWNVSAITTPSDCEKMNKIVNSDEIINNQSVFIEQLSWINETMKDISQQCLQVSNSNNKRNSDLPVDPLGISMMTIT